MKFEFGKSADLMNELCELMGLNLETWASPPPSYFLNVYILNTASHFVPYNWTKNRKAVSVKRDVVWCRAQAFVLDWARQNCASLACPEAFPDVLNFRRACADWPKPNRKRFGWLFANCFPNQKIHSGCLWWVAMSQPAGRTDRSIGGR